VVVHTAGGESGGVEQAAALLLGREAELGVVYGLIDEVGEGGSALVVRGEPGIGKSSLLTAASARAREKGMTVITTTGVQSEARLGFAGLHQLLLPFRSELGRLPDPQRRALEAAFGMVAGEGADRFLIGLATLSLVSELGSESPLLLVVDDAHWLDSSSSNALGFVGRRLGVERAILLCAVRDGAANDLDEAALPELRLTGLDEGPARSLVELHGPALTDDLKARIVIEAAGNPLALIELPSAAAGLPAEDAKVTTSLPLTSRLERAFATRLDDLDAGTRALLLVAALEDGELNELALAAQIVHGSVVDPEAWAPAVAGALGALNPDGFQFRHPLIRSAVQQAATLEERRLAHAALADALAGHPDRAVWHRAAAATGHDEEVAVALDATGDRARLRGASAVAVAALEQAAELTADPSRRAIRVFRAAELSHELGQAQKAVRLLRTAQHLGLPSRERALASFYLEALEGTWSGTSTVRDFAAVATEFAVAGEQAAALEALETIALRAHWSNLDPVTRREITAAAKQAGAPADDPSRLAVLALVDPVQSAAEVLGHIRNMSPAAFGDPKHLLVLGDAAFAVWAEDLALPFLRAAGAAFRIDGRLALLAHTTVTEAWADVHLGHVRTALTEAAEGARLSEEAGQARYVPAAKLAQAIALAELGEDEAAEQLIGEVEAVLLPMGANPLLSLAALARGRKELAAGRVAEAYENLARIFDPADVAHQPFVRGRALADLAEAAAAGGGSPDVARGYVAEWQEIAAATKAPHLEVQLAYASAVLADDAAAEESFHAAIRAGTAGWPSYAARTQLAYGAWLRRQRRVAESRAPLREAAQAFDALGQLCLAERARGELRATGETARRRVPEAWARLSPQELQIAQLAAEGLSNRQIGERLYLSHRTVGSHLYRLFPKLGVTSRAQLRDALAAGGGLVNASTREEQSSDSYD
jgi:DNA-binding NarL/FixJ family response regulator